MNTNKSHCECTIHMQMLRTTLYDCIISNVDEITFSMCSICKSEMITATVTYNMSNKMPLIRMSWRVIQHSFAIINDRPITLQKWRIREMYMRNGINGKTMIKWKFAAIFFLIETWNVCVSSMSTSICMYTCIWGFFFCLLICPIFSYVQWFYICCHCLHHWKMFEIFFCSVVVVVGDGCAFHQNIFMFEFVCMYLRANVCIEYWVNPNKCSLSFTCPLYSYA